MASISERCRDARQRIEGLISAIDDNAQPQRAVLIDTLERFMLWAGNLGAMRQTSSRLSLDQRLAAAPEIHDLICRHLDDICEAVDDLSRLLLGGAAAESEEEERAVSDSESVEQATEESEEEPFDEAAMIVEVIGESITLLFRLGILVRKASPTDRFKRALQMSSAPFNESFDISYVTEKHPKMKDSGAGWLTTRLGRIISQRRLFIKYSRDHKVRLAFDGAIPDQLATQTERQSSKASTFHLEQLPMSALASATPGTQMQQLEEEDVDDVMSVMSASTMSDNLSVLRLPSLADLSVDGKPFECPICFTLQHFHREKAWRVHAFRDLKAYVCTAGGPDQCESEYFGDRNTWFEHELYQHRSQYVCALCQDDQPVSRAVFRLHMAESHQQVPEQQVAAVEDLSRQTPTHFDAADCPFCDDWAEQIRQRADTKGKRPMVIPAAASRAKSVTLVSATRFKRHVALHQEQLAIFALPRHTEDGDVQDSDEAGRSLSSGSLSTLSQASSQSGARMEAAGLDKDTPMIGEEESSLREPHTISGTAMNNNLDTIELDFHEHFLPLCVQLSINQDLSPEDSKEEFHLLCMKVRREVFSKLWQANTGGSKELRARKEAIEREVQGVLLGLSEAVAEKTHKKPPDHEWANLGQSTVHQATLQARSLMEAMDIPPTVLTQLLGRVVPHDTKTWSQLRQWRTVTPISMEIQTQLYSIQFRQFGTMLEQLRHSPAPDPEPEFQPEPRPSPLPFSATETQTPADPSAIRTLIMPDHMRWVFMDSQGTTLGPLDGLEMHRRFQAKLFTLDTRVKRLEDPDFEYLSQLSQRLGNSREPFLVPQVGISYGPPPQTGSAMLDLRRLSIANTDVQDQRPELLKWLGSINEEGKRGDQNGEPVPSGTANGHRRGTSHESISWLDPIDESGGSSASSVHLRSSSLRIRRKHIRAASGDTDAEFEAALDDAIEAAYDDGFKSESDFHDDNSSEDKELIPEDNAAMKATPLDERGVTEAYERGRMEFDELEGPHADARRAALGAEPKQNLGDLASTLEQHLSGTAARYERAQEVDDAGKDDVSGIKIKFEERMRKSTSKHSLSLEFPCNYEKAMEGIKAVFKDGEDMVSRRIQQGRFFLIDSENAAITDQTKWDFKMTKPGTELTLRSWIRISESSEETTSGVFLDFNNCTYQSLISMIKARFTHRNHDFQGRFQRGFYDLVTPDRTVITEHNWDEVVTPGCDITIELWSDGMIAAAEKQAGEINTATSISDAKSNRGGSSITNYYYVWFCCQCNDGPISYSASPTCFNPSCAAFRANYAHDRCRGCRVKKHRQPAHRQAEPQPSNKENNRNERTTLITGSQPLPSPLNAGFNHSATGPPEDDFIFFKYREDERYLQRFPAHSISGGKLLVRDVLERAIVMLFEARNRNRMRLFFDGRPLTRLDVPLREYGVENESELMIVIGDLVAADAVNSQEVIGGDDDPEPAAGASTQQHTVLDPHEPRKCAFCLDAVEETQAATFDCGHLAHRRCYDRWYAGEDDAQLCRVCLLPLPYRAGSAREVPTADSPEKGEENMVGGLYSEASSYASSYAGSLDDLAPEEQEPYVYDENFVYGSSSRNSKKQEMLPYEISTEELRSNADDPRVRRVRGMFGRVFGNIPGKGEENVVSDLPSDGSATGEQNVNDKPGDEHGGETSTQIRPVQPDSETRSKSVADGRAFKIDGLIHGRPIIHMARALYMYQASIPEELGFSKGDMLAVLRHQDDGWWEATIEGGNGQVGLVPSNYLQPC